MFCSRSKSYETHFYPEVLANNLPCCITILPPSNFSYNSALDSSVFIANEYGSNALIFITNFFINAKSCKFLFHGNFTKADFSSDDSDRIERL